MNFNKLSFLIFFLIAKVNFIYGQDDITIGKKYTITSELLDQEREIQVYVPDGYDQTDKEYPVLYILDGQWHFANGVAIQKSLRVPDRLPEMIVVGIVTDGELRETHFWQEKEKFLSFLDSEVFSFMDDNFRTSSERVLFGWQMGGYFAGFALLNERQLFNAAITSNGSYANEEMIDSFNSLDITDNKYLYIANSTKDIYTISGTDSFSNLLKEKSPYKLTWKYEQFNEEIHESLAYLALYHGLNYYYHDFQSLVFGSIAEFQDAGGIPYLEAYSKKRGERYGLPTEIDNSIKDGLIWLAWNRDDYKSFHFFMEEFEEVLSTQRYASAYWQNRFGQFYLKHEDFENAILYFNAGITTYPDSSRLAEMYSGLGMAQLKKEDKKQARKNLKRAVEIAEQQSDPDLERYRLQLSQIKNKD